MFDEEVGDPGTFGHGEAAGSRDAPLRPGLSRCEVLAFMRDFVSGLDGPSLSRPQAVDLVGFFTTVINTAETGRAIAARRATAGGAHLREAKASPARWLAEEAGTGLGRAIGAIEAATAATESPELDKAMREGAVSPDAARIVAQVATLHPAFVAELVELARAGSSSALRRRAEELKAEALGERDKLASAEELHRRRYLRAYLQGDGAVRGEFLLPAESYGVLRAGLDERRKAILESARQALGAGEGRSGGLESPAAYDADALVGLAGAGTGPRARVVLRVDVSALRRGELEGDELCELRGVGPVSLAHAKELLGDAVTDLVIRDGTEIKAVTSLGRSISRALRLALYERDRCCVVPGCGREEGLEIDHWRVDFALGGRTELDNLALLCRFHHRLKTYRGWRLEGGPGHWRFAASGDATGPGPFDEEEDGAEDPGLFEAVGFATRAAEQQAGLFSPRAAEQQAGLFSPRAAEQQAAEHEDRAPGPFGPHVERPGSSKRPGQRDDRTRRSREERAPGSWAVPEAASAPPDRRAGSLPKRDRMRPSAIRWPQP